jgi:hypothetical protein
MDQSTQQENGSSDLRNVNLTASKRVFSASTHGELNDPVVVARRNHPNWIAKRSKFLRLSTYEFFYDNNYNADDEDDYKEFGCYSNDLSKFGQTIDEDGDDVPDLEKCNETENIKESNNCDERKYVCEKCRKKYCMREK